MTQDNTNVQQEILDELSNADFAGAGVNTGVAAGSVVLHVTNVYLNRSAKSNRKQMVAVTTIVQHDEAPDSVGATYTKTWGLETAENLRWLNTDLTNLNIKLPVNGADLQRVMKELNDIYFAATLQANPGYQPNCYINEGARRSAPQAGSPTKSGAAPF